MTNSDTDLEGVLESVRACRLCAPHLPHEPRPVLQAAPEAKILIVGQAPGARVQASGRPFTDPSGDRLRDWLQMSPQVFYDANRVAIVPMGFCYPGTSPKGGDYPPRPECAPQWRQRVLDQLPHIGLTIVVGQYAQAWHLGARRKRTLTETVKAFSEYAPKVFPLPHPSWRNTGWLKRNPWFEADLLPPLRQSVQQLLSDND